MQMFLVPFYYICCLMTGHSNVKVTLMLSFEDTIVILYLTVDLFCVKVVEIGIVLGQNQTKPATHHNREHP